MPCSRPATSVPSTRHASKRPRKPAAADISVEHAIGLFLDRLVARQRQESTVITQGDQLRRFFRPVLDEPLRSLTRERAQQLAKTLAETPSVRTGAPLAPATLNFYIESAKRFCRWAVAQGRLPVDPMSTEKLTIAELQAEIVELRRQLAEAREQLRALDKGE